MKKILLLFILVTLVGCSSKVDEVVSLKYQNNWYWVLQIKKGATKEDVLQKVKRWSNPNNTSYFFVYRDTLDLSAFKKKDITFPYFTDLVISNIPTYGFYKMPNDDKIYDDAVWLLEQGKK
ncbi:hypothetical protein PG913_08355 [Tenacibaculum pacificus]|uniref:hypothetical protein n=1 Tax=Tenacibaculum TaxID=104267 RepID=UPI0022F38F43|nr:hypothetical protein [Tenacibaculum pacificus]WBX72914.1 hypothetical protein PG913_08355 [Tenacibaculum pacificus]